MDTTSSSSRRSGRGFRVLVSLGCAVGVAAAGAGTAVAAGAAVVPVRSCFVTPAADAQPLGAYLVGMYRADGATMEVLHRVECNDHVVSYRWIPASFADG